MKGGKQEIAFAVDCNISQCNEWWIDSGASRHMKPEKKGLCDYIVLVKLADNSILLAYGKGSLRVTVCDGQKRWMWF